MLYKDISKEDFKRLFQNPTAEYRATPFWAWNCKLEEEELLRQIDIFKEMGFGGFHMHSRSGMATTYLSDEFMHMVKACTEKAKKEGMLSWLYDEDRWPSGSAGGYVTKDRSLRSRHILFSKKTYDTVSAEVGIREGKTYLLAAFDIIFDEQGRLLSYRQISENEDAAGEKWFVYVKVADDSPWYNGQAYVDTLSKAAIRKFIDITYETYKETVGDEFGHTVPAIFTDEPQFERKETADHAKGDEEIKLPWTPDLPETYKAAYGEDVVPFLPELRWDKSEGYSLARYRYHDHVCDRFVAAFVDQCGAWCKEHGIALTGHMMEEPTLTKQTHALGEAMRCYRSMEIPGIDMLCNDIELGNAKQAESAKNQFGRKGMTAELYGVTGWGFDFRGHKFQGDWLAALGVTVRVPHLSWASMKGMAKRDFPATFNYQIPWHREYRVIEDHYARLATVLTRGKPVVKIGVIHPIESFWLLWGPKDTGEAKRADMEEAHEALYKRLLFGGMDFDFISEALLPELYKESESGFTVGEMRYDTIIVPELITMRASTVKLLSNFKSRGGKLVFLGECPTHIDAVPSEGVRKLYDCALHATSPSETLLSLLEDERLVELRNADGTRTSDLIYQLREDERERYLFIAHAKEPRDKGTALPRELHIGLTGGYLPTLLDTASGEEKAIDYEIAAGKTFITYMLGPSDSLLLHLTPCEAGKLLQEKDVRTPAKTIDFKEAVDFSREEDNVLLLDLCEWSEDGECFAEAEEILRLDMALRNKYGYTPANGCYEQPWVIPDTPATHFPVLRFRFDAEIETPVSLAVEEATEIVFNGEKISLSFDGYFADKAIRRLPLPKTRLGENVLTVKMPITTRMGLEACYLLGDFDVRAEGCRKTITAPRHRLPFGNAAVYGMPFYGGNLTYKMDFETPKGDIDVRITHYAGAMLRLYIDGKDEGELIYSPYIKRITGLSAGRHTLEVKVYGTRQNTFAPLHLAASYYYWLGPGSWYTRNGFFSYEYNLSPFGVLTSPVISVYPKTE